MTRLVLREIYSRHDDGYDSSVRVTLVVVLVEGCVAGDHAHEETIKLTENRPERD